MLTSRRMSSHGGQESFPFGYNPNVVQNIGLPDFMTPGPPTGQPLLNDDENANFNNFLSGFDANQMHDKQGNQQQYQMNNVQAETWNMPPNFVGSETTMGLLAGVHPSELERYAMMYGDGLGTRVPGVHVNHASHILYGNSGHHGLQDNWSASLFHQVPSAASPNIQPGYSSGWQNQQLQAQGVPLQTPGRGPPMRFGSDSHFQPNGYSGQPLQMPESELQTLEWLESTPNTRPNTRPNTQPSSPNRSKKRKLDDYQSEHRNGFVPRNGQPPRRQTSSQMKPESRGPPPTPITSSKPPSLSDQYPQDEDAEAEDDDDPTATTTALPSREPSPPAPWPSNKARPPKSNKPSTPAKPSRKRKTATDSSNTTNIPKKSARKQSTRVPLTQEQKKANHTNSEQRRRDATARAYADLYDLVPEVAAMGKQSTMKKLEVVVDKVRQTIQNVESLRARLGVQAGGSIADAAAAQGLDPAMFAGLMGLNRRGVGSGRDEDEDESEDDDGGDGGDDDENDEDEDDGDDNDGGYGGGGNEAEDG